MADQLIIRGAREHNLKDVSLDLPRDALIVFTGLSGSGKSSLAFDTIFAEGQRRYVESLSAYARQFLGQMDKPDVDFIEGLSPAVSIDQKSTSQEPALDGGHHHRGLRLHAPALGPRGPPHCPTCGAPDRAQTPQQIVDRCSRYPEGRRFQVLAPVIRGRKGEYVELFKMSCGVQGFSAPGSTARPTRRSTSRRSSTSSSSTPSRSWSTGSWSRSRAASKPAAHRLGRDRAQSLAEGLMSSPTSSTSTPRTTRSREERFSEHFWPAPTSTPSTSTRSSRAPSPSTRPSVPARPATAASAPRWRSTPSSSSPTRTATLGEGAI